MHDHTASGACTDRNRSSSDDTPPSAAEPAVRAGVPPLARTASRRRIIRCIGSMAAPLSCAGQLSVQRPHSVHANAFRRETQVSSRTVPAPGESARSGGTGRMAPAGSGFRKKTLKMAKTMWECFV